MPLSHLDRSNLEQRDDALDALHEAIIGLEETGRELSRWEKMYLVSAFACFAIGSYVLAEVEADLALSSSSREHALRKILDSTSIPEVSFQELKNALDLSRLQPVAERMRFPFGQAGS